ncbi:MAG: GAF domain-containing protein [Armatimonadetes bacterium]|nr:GAF domain-containing protein [Armatimonadota bacterium]
MRSLVDDALNFLKAHQSERGLVLLKEPASGNFVVRGVFGMAPDVLATQKPVALLLEKARHEGRACLVLDADQEPIFRTMVELLDFRSALCIPMVRESGEVIGVLYGDSERAAGVYSHSSLHRGEELCGELAERWNGTPAAALPPPPPKPPIAAVIAAVLALTAIGWGLARPASRPAPIPTAAPPLVTPQTARPETIAESFLREIRAHHFADAHRLLSFRLQEELPLSAFERRCVEWSQDDTNRWELQYRRVRVQESGDTFARFVVEPRQPDRAAWTWKLARQSDGWRIDEMPEGPFSRP